MTMLPPLPKGMKLDELDQEEKETRKRLYPEFKAQYTALAVDPQGRVREQVCFPPLNGGNDGERLGDVMFHWYDGKPMLQSKFRKLGFTTFEEECEASDQPEFPAKYRALVLARLQGTRITGLPDAFLPRTVLEKRGTGNTESAGPKMSASRLSDRLEGMLGSETMKEMVAKARAAEAADPEPEVEPEPKAKKSVKKGSRSLPLEGVDV